MMNAQLKGSDLRTRIYLRQRFMELISAKPISRSKPYGRGFGGTRQNHSTSDIDILFRPTQFKGARFDANTACLSSRRMQSGTLGYIESP